MTSSYHAAYAQRHPQPGHEAHRGPTEGCSPCQREACDAWAAKRDAYNAALAAWKPYRPITRREAIVGILEFPLLVIGGIALWFGFYSPGILLAFRPLSAIGLGWVDAGDALQWLLIGTLLVTLIHAVGGDDRSVPRPVFPKMDQFTYTAWQALYDRPRLRGEPLDEHLDRINRMWPVTAARGAAPIIEPAARRPRRPTVRQREVIASWNLPERQPGGPDDLPF